MAQEGGEGEGMVREEGLAYDFVMKQNAIKLCKVTPFSKTQHVLSCTEQGGAVMSRNSLLNKNPDL